MKIKEYCGISGIIGNVENIYEKMFQVLFSLQHRGQESCGITIKNGIKFYNYKRMGFVGELKKIKNHINEGSAVIGHVRYKTAGDSSIFNAQPVFAETHFGNIALAHNGNIINTNKLRRELIKKGAIFQGNSDSEIILHLLARKRGNFIDILKGTLNEIKGAYSLVILTDDALYGIRDPLGYRPLVYGTVENGYIISSETCAIDVLNGNYIGEIPPGKILKIDRNGKLEFIQFNQQKYFQQCVFEYIYFARPDSIIFNNNVHKMRFEMGKELAKENRDIKADIIVPVPDSGFSASLGFASESGIKIDRGIIRNHYVGRSFIQPTMEERKNIIRMKLRPVLEVIKDKNIILIDDSIVRGSTIREIVLLLKKYKVGKIFFLVSSPPIKHPCYFGIDTPTREELIANKFTSKSLAKFLNIEEVRYLSINGLKKVLGNSAKNFCLACFNGSYPEEFKNYGLL